MAKKRTERVKFDEKFGWLILIIFGIVIIFNLLDVNPKITEWFIDLFASVSIGMVTSLIIGSLIERFGGSFLKKISWNKNLEIQYINQSFFDSNFTSKTNNI